MKKIIAMVWQCRCFYGIAERVKKNVRVPDLPETVRKSMAGIREAGVRELTAG